MINGKPRILLLGGKSFNVPRQLADHFELVRHIEQDEKKTSTLPSADYIVVITNWVNHRTIQTAQKELPGVPVVYVRAGWKSMMQEFVRRGMMEQPAEPVPDDPPEPVPEESALAPLVDSLPVPEGAKAVGSESGLMVLHDVEEIMTEYILLSQDKEAALAELKRAQERVATLSLRLDQLRPVAEAMSAIHDAVKKVRGKA